MTLQEEIEEYINNGGKIEKLDSINLSGKEYASEYQIKNLKDWFNKHESYLRKLQTHVNKRVKNQPKNWIANSISGRRKLPMQIYNIILEEIENGRFR